MLAPAGDWQAARAAVENGADAVYFGLDTLNARLRAQNFRQQELAELLHYLHSRGVRGYLTVNTLVGPDELPAAETLLRTAIEAGVDALIVQDVGLCRLVRRLSPDVPLHASTQMTVSSAAGLRYAATLGCTLVTLARELNLDEIARLVEAAGPGGPKLEVFVHGALCVSYSGQCLASLAFGGRSANRGACAQPCRLPYDLILDGNAVPLGGRFLLSPRDLCALQVLPELVKLGVAVLKIEGRLKSAEYVAAATRAYRDALDRCAATEPSAASLPTIAPALERRSVCLTGRNRGDASSARSEEGAYREYVTDERRSDAMQISDFATEGKSIGVLELTFSRGLCEGWYRGPRHRELVNAVSGQKRGIQVGRVLSATAAQVTAQLSRPLAPGDGVLLIGPASDHGLGGRVYSVEQRGSSWLLGFDDSLDLEAVSPGDAIWKTSDPALERRLRQSFADGAAPFARPVDLLVSGRFGKALAVEARDDLGHTVRVTSTVPLTAARRHALDKAVLRAQLGRLGGSPFRLRALEAQLEGALMLPLSQLNRVRRELVRSLTELRAQPPRWPLAPALADRPTARSSTSEHAAPTLAVLVRTASQLEAALDSGVDLVYLDLADTASLPGAIAVARQTGARVLLAGPRINKPGEEHLLDELRALAPDGFLARNAAQLEAFTGSSCVADTSLNATNALSVEHLLGLGVQRVTAALDLAPAQLEALLREAPAGSLEVVVRLHEPLFHTELCLFRAHLDTCRDASACDRPCRRGELRLRDRKGVQHLALVDSRCRSTLFHARARDLTTELPRLLEAGASVIRCELLDETPEQTHRLLARLLSALDVRGERSNLADAAVAEAPLRKRRR